jgi:hypothetical protein
LQQLLAVERLRQEPEDAALRRGDGVRNRAVRGQDDDRQRRMLAMNRLEELQAVDARHLEVGYHYARPRDGKRRERRLAAVGRAHLVPAELSRRLMSFRRSGSSSTSRMSPWRVVVVFMMDPQPPPPPPPPPPPLPPLEPPPASASATASDAVAQKIALHVAERLEFSLRGSAFCCSSRTARMRSATWTCTTGASCFAAGEPGVALDDAVQQLHRTLVVLRGLRERQQHSEADAVVVRALLRNQLIHEDLLAARFVRAHCAIALKIGQHARELLLVGRLGRGRRRRRLGQRLERRLDGRRRQARRRAGAGRGAPGSSGGCSNWRRRRRAAGDGAGRSTGTPTAGVRRRRRRCAAGEESFQRQRQSEPRRERQPAASRHPPPAMRTCVAAAVP